MHNYYYKLGYHLLSEEVKTELRTNALANKHKFTDHKSDTGEPDGNKMRYLMPNLPEQIQRMMKSCVLPVFPVMILHEPGAVVVKHYDGRAWNRQAVISIPVGLGEHTPTYFWESKDSEEPVAIATYDNNLPVVLNVNEYHSLVNSSDEIRLCFQFSFNEPIETIISLLEKEMLFSKI